MKKLFTFCFAAFCCAWALSGCNESDSQSGTPEPPPVATPNFKFELVDKTSGSITVQVTPENFDENYFWAAIAEATLQEKYGNDPAAAAADVVAMLHRYADYGYNSFEEFYADQVSLGVSTETYGGFKAETPIVCLAFGLTEAGVISTEIILSSTFTTAAVAQSENTFEISIIDKTIVRVEPSNNDTYTFYVFPKIVIDAYESLDAFAEEFVATNQASMDVLTFSGARQSDFYDILSKYGAGTFVAFAFGYESGCVTTAVTTKEFEYEVADPSVGDPFTRLKGDVSVDCTEAYFETAFEDALLNNDQVHAYFLALRAESSFYGPETRLCLYLLKEISSTLPGSMAGTYKINASLAAESITKGWKDADGWHHGSIYYEKDSYSPDASIDSGTVTIVDNADGTYTVTVEAQDMEGHAIRANFTGAIPEYTEE